MEATRQLRKMSQTERYKRSQTDLGRYIIMLFCLQIYKNNPFFFLYHSEYSKFLSISLNATVFSKKKPQQKKTSCSLSTEVLNVSGSSACHREPHNMAYNSAMKIDTHTQVPVPWILSYSERTGRTGMPSSLIQ